MLWAEYASADVQESSIALSGLLLIYSSLVLTQIFIKS